MDTRPELNVTPLIDVLLVLITILILAVPILTHNTKIALPRAPVDHKPIVVDQLDIDSTGVVYWNDTMLTSAEAIQATLTSSAKQGHTILRITPERRAPYERVAQVLAAAQHAGIARLSLTPIADR